MCSFAFYCYIGLGNCMMVMAAAVLSDQPDFSVLFLWSGGVLICWNYSEIDICLVPNRKKNDSIKKYEIWIHTDILCSKTLNFNGVGDKQYVWFYRMYP